MVWCFLNRASQYTPGWPNSPSSCLASSVLLLQMAARLAHTLILSPQIIQRAGHRPDTSVSAPFLLHCSPVTVTCQCVGSGGQRRVLRSHISPAIFTWIPETKELQASARGHWQSKLRPSNQASHSGNQLPTYLHHFVQKGPHVDQAILELLIACLFSQVLRLQVCTTTTS